MRFLLKRPKELKNIRKQPRHIHNKAQVYQRDNVFRYVVSCRESGVTAASQDRGWSPPSRCFPVGR